MCIIQKLSQFIPVYSFHKFSFDIFNQINCKPTNRRSAEAYRRKSKDIPVSSVFNHIFAKTDANLLLILFPSVALTILELPQLSRPNTVRPTNNLMVVNTSEEHANVCALNIGLFLQFKSDIVSYVTGRSAMFHLSAAGDVRIFTGLPAYGARKRFANGLRHCRQRGTI
jgi:hypothetical protein